MTNHNTIPKPEPPNLQSKLTCYDSTTYCLLSIWQEAHVGPVVEENSYSVIGQLVAEPILVGVVHPFSDPLKTAAV